MRERPQRNGSVSWLARRARRPVNTFLTSFNTSIKSSAGALVIDTQVGLEFDYYGVKLNLRRRRTVKKGSEEEEELMEDISRRRVRPVRGGHGLPIQHPHPLGFPVGGPFRIGLAGRGATGGGDCKPFCCFSRCICMRKSWT
jgi:hypothetical protein